MTPYVRKQTRGTLKLPYGAALLLLCLGSGCATIRVTDPARTATEQFLMSQASEKAVKQISAAPLLDRLVYIDENFLPSLKTDAQTSAEIRYLIGELRSHLLLAGVRLTDEREKAEIVLEPRTQGVGVDRTEFLLGIPAIYIPGATGSVPVATPELAIVKRTTQKGFGSVAYVAYWRESGEVVGSSGPFAASTERKDYWFFGVGPTTTGDIIPATQGKVGK